MNKGSPHRNHVLTNHHIPHLSLEPLQQPLTHRAGVQHSLRSGEGLGHHDSEGGLGVQAGQGALSVDGVYVLHNKNKIVVIDIVVAIKNM